MLQWGTEGVIFFAAVDGAGVVWAFESDGLQIWDWVGQNGKVSVESEGCQFLRGFHQAWEVAIADPNLIPLFIPGKANATVFVFAK